jgi:hypothetical protein
MRQPMPSCAITAARIAHAIKASQQQQRALNVAEID